MQRSRYDDGMLKRWPLFLLAMAMMAAAQMRDPSMSQARPESSAHKPGELIAECPWLTRGTAAVVLGGDVSLAVNMRSEGTGSCLFRNKQRLSEELAITVSRTPPPGCGKKRAMLTGIANWATLCSTSRWHHRHTETVSGQARNSYFIVALSFKQRK